MAGGAELATRVTSSAAFACIASDVFRSSATRAIGRVSKVPGSTGPDDSRFHEAVDGVTEHAALLVDHRLPTAPLCLVSGAVVSLCRGQVTPSHDLRPVNLQVCAERRQ